jgi:hypothetical protein
LPGGRLSHNHYVWIALPNGEWTNYSHLAHNSVTVGANLKVGAHVAAGYYLRDEDANRCATLKHVHFGRMTRKPPSTRVSSPTTTAESASETRSSVAC